MQNRQIIWNLPLLRMLLASLFMFVAFPNPTVAQNPPNSPPASSLENPEESTAALQSDSLSAGQIVFSIFGIVVCWAAFPSMMSGWNKHRTAPLDFFIKRLAFSILVGSVLGVMGYGMLFASS